MTAFEYAPTGMFAHVYKTPFGRKLWSFLTTDEAVLVMRVADHLGRPAIEALTPFLLDKFGSQIHDDSVKKTIGHMVGAIQRQRGKEIKSYIKLRDKSIFGAGTVWK